MQAFMRHFSIRIRMIGAIAVVLALLAAVGGSGLWGMTRLSAVAHEFSEHAFKETVTLSQLKAVLGDLAKHEKDMVIAYERPEQVAEAKARWTAAHTAAVGQMQSMLAGEEDDDNVIVRELQKSLEAYVAAVEPVTRQLADSGYETATIANRMLARAHTHQAAMTEQLGRIEAAIAEEVQSLEAEGAAANSQTLWVFSAALLVAMLVVVPTTLANMQSICAPLDRARSVADAIAAGDLTQPVHDNGRDELARLMVSLSAMQTSLSRIVAEVRSSTESIGTASTQIASGNQDLSGRTEQAASSLQETAASMDQLSSTVRQSADAARQANEMASANALVAARGGQVVGQVVSTMQDIQHSSQKIGDIISVIDGIAFQTNILALNAAVEAARAGEQGRGFAVVASEVRSLAQRSAEAAKEIKALIGASVDKVQTGTELVAQAGTTISEIVDNAQKISTFIADVTTAAQEQSQGIGQVNSAVGQLDQMTQQNAALVEESAAAAESLREQAGRLAQVVQVFRLQA
ncbi:methyl-accepting chemotaxis protein [Hydrogenophaga sp. XSHU_21]